jgi:hypothetical protein
MHVTSIALGLLCLGCVLLSLSLRRHYREVLPDESRYADRKWPLRWAGYAALALALWPAMLAAGAWVGMVLWLSMLALAAMAQLLLLTYRPHAMPMMVALGIGFVAAGLLA